MSNSPKTLILCVHDVMHRGGSFIGVVTFKGQISMRSSHFYEWVVSNQGNCMCLLGQKWRVCVCVSVGYAG